LSGLAISAPPSVVSLGGPIVEGEELSLPFPEPDAEGAMLWDPPYVQVGEMRGKLSPVSGVACMSG